MGFVLAHKYEQIFGKYLWNVLKKTNNFLNPKKIPITVFFLPNHFSKQTERLNIR